MIWLVKSKQNWSLSKNTEQIWSLKLILEPPLIHGLINMSKINQDLSTKETNLLIYIFKIISKPLILCLISLSNKLTKTPKIGMKELLIF